MNDRRLRSGELRCKGLKNLYTPLHATPDLNKNLNNDLNTDLNNDSKSIAVNKLKARATRSQKEAHLDSLLRSPPLQASPKMAPTLTDSVSDFQTVLVADFLLGLTLWNRIRFQALTDHYRRDGLSEHDSGLLAMRRMGGFVNNEWFEWQMEGNEA